MEQAPGVIREHVGRESKDERETSKCPVTRISIQDVLKNTGRLVHEKCPKSQRRGTPSNRWVPNMGRKADTPLVCHQCDFYNSRKPQELAETEQVTPR